MAEPWDGDEARFRDIRARIGGSLAGVQKPGTLAGIYKTQAGREPLDAVKQFRWATAVYLAAQEDDTFRNSGEVGKALKALARVPSPRTFEFARLRFLLEALDAPDRRLLTIGDRLIRRAPEDHEVKYQLIGVIDPRRSEAAKARAVTYARELIRAEPSDAKHRSALGGVYFKLWLSDKSAGHASKAVAAYRDYLRIAPPTEAFRDQARRIIRFIEKYQGKQEANT